MLLYSQLPFPYEIMNYSLKLAYIDVHLPETKRCYFFNACTHYFKYVSTQFHRPDESTLHKDKISSLRNIF